MSDSDNSESDNYTSASDTRSESKSGGGGRQQKISYSTDYHVDMLEDTQKMLPRDKRKPHFIHGMTSKPVVPEPMNHGKSDEASESMDDYITSKDVESEQTKKYGGHSGTNYFANNGTPDAPPPTSATQNNSQIFSKFVGADDYDTLPPDAQMMKRLNLMRRLGELARDKGITLSQKYNINSDYYMMKYEYNLHKDIIDKQEFTNVATSVMRYAIYGLEKLNENYNTVLDLRLNGWSDEVGANMEKFTTIWGDIYEKYNQPGKGTEPEYRLIFALACGGIGYHMNNSGNDRPKPVKKERDPEAELRRDAELKQKEIEKHKQAERTVQEMARLNEISQQNERLRFEQDKLQKERDEFEQFRQAQQVQKQQMQQMMMNSQQYNNNNHDARQRQIGEQLNNMRNNINQNTVPLGDVRGEPPATRQKTVATPPPQPAKKKGITVDTSSSSSLSSEDTPPPKKNDKKSGGTSRSTYSKRSTGVKKSGGITIMA